MEVLPADGSLLSQNYTRGHALQRYRTPMASPSVSSEFGVCQKFLRSLYRTSNISLRQVERLRAHLHRIFILRTTDNTIFLLKCSPSRDMRLLRHETESLETESRILELITTSSHVPVPRLLHYDSQLNNNIRSPYILRSFIPGATLADTMAYLSIAERVAIDRSLGSYLHSLTQIKHDSFGASSKVYASQGSSRWSEAFCTLLESSLRDAEDVLVSLPYDTIRYYAATHRAVLDEIDEPRLCAMEAGRPEKVLLDERRKHVVGLLGFSNVIWGDPLLAGVFAGASGGFWEGFGGRPDNTAGYRIRCLL